MTAVPTPVRRATAAAGLICFAATATAAASTATAEPEPERQAGARHRPPRPPRPSCAPAGARTSWPAGAPGCAAAAPGHARARRAAAPRRARLDDRRPDDHERVERASAWPSGRRARAAAGCA